MILKAFAIYDNIAGAYNQPFFTHNRGTAIRSLVNEMQKPDNPLSKNPDHFALFELGEYNDENGRFTPAEVPTSLGLVQEFIQRQ